MDFWQLLQNNWLSLVQTSGIISAIVFSYRQLRITARNTKLQVDQQIVLSHRDYWKLMYQYPQLSRILEENVDLTAQPITRFEKSYVGMMINHVMFMMESHKMKLYDLTSGDELDFKEFFNLPIPSKVWEETKKFHNADLVSKLDKIIKTS